MEKAVLLEFCDVYVHLSDSCSTAERATPLEPSVTELRKQLRQSLGVLHGQPDEACYHADILEVERGARRQRHDPRGQPLGRRQAEPRIQRKIRLHPVAARMEVAP